jgi:hypothetical protein
MRFLRVSCKSYVWRSDQKHGKIHPECWSRGMGYGNDSMNKWERFCKLRQCLVCDLRQNVFNLYFV